MHWFYLLLTSWNRGNYLPWFPLWSLPHGSRIFVRRRRQLATEPLEWNFWQMSGKSWKYLTRQRLAPGPTAWEPCSLNATAVICFWMKRVGSFGLKKKAKRTYWLNNFSCILHMRRKVIIFPQSSPSHSFWFFDRKFAGNSRLLWWFKHILNHWIDSMLKTVVKGKYLIFGQLNNKIRETLIYSHIFRITFCLVLVINIFQHPMFLRERNEHASWSDCFFAWTTSLRAKKTSSSWRR